MELPLVMLSDLDEVNKDTCGLICGSPTPSGNYRECEWIDLKVVKAFFERD